MGHPPQTVLADAEGFWEETAPGEKRLLIAWAETLAVGGAKYDAGDRVLIAVELDTDYGETIEVFTDWPGFDEFARTVPQCLPGLPADWLQRIIDLPPAAGTEVGRRALR